MTLRVQPWVKQSLYWKSSPACSRFSLLWLVSWSPSTCCRVAYGCILQGHLVEPKSKAEVDQRAQAHNNQGEKKDRSTHHWHRCRGQFIIFLILVLHVVNYSLNILFYFWLFLLGLRTKQEEGAHIHSLLNAIMKLSAFYVSWGRRKKNPLLILTCCLGIAQKTLARLCHIFGKWY